MNSFIYTSNIKILQTVGFIGKAFHSEISGQNKIKHSKMGEKQ